MLKNDLVALTTKTLLILFSIATASAQNTGCHSTISTENSKEIPFNFFLQRRNVTLNHQTLPNSFFSDWYEYYTNNTSHWVYVTIEDLKDRKVKILGPGRPLVIISEGAQIENSTIVVENNGPIYIRGKGFTLKENSNLIVKTGNGYNVEFDAKAYNDWLANIPRKYEVLKNSSFRVFSGGSLITDQMSTSTQDRKLTFEIGDVSDSNYSDVSTIKFVANDDFHWRDRIDFIRNSNGRFDFMAKNYIIAGEVTDALSNPVIAFFDFSEDAALQNPPQAGPAYNFQFSKRVVSKSVELQGKVSVGGSCGAENGCDVKAGFEASVDVFTAVKLFGMINIYLESLDTDRCWAPEICSRLAVNWNYDFGGLNYHHDHCGNRSSMAMNMVKEKQISASYQTDDRVAVYPNPTADILNIVSTDETQGNEIKSVKLYSLTGQLLLHQENANKQKNYSFDLNAVSTRRDNLLILVIDFENGESTTEIIALK